jgi:hypothetical protein
MTNEIPLWEVFIRPRNGLSNLGRPLRRDHRIGSRA